MGFFVTRLIDDAMFSLRGYRLIERALRVAAAIVVFWTALARQAPLETIWMDKLSQNCGFFSRMIFECSGGEEKMFETQ
jgi:hypothetical protein